MELVLYKPSTPSPINFHDIILGSFTYSDQDLGDGLISAEHFLPELVESEDWIGCYVTYAGEHFEIFEPPTKTRDNTALGFKYTLKLEPYKSFLKNWYFLDYVSAGSDILYTGLASTHFYGNVVEFMGRLTANLSKKDIGWSIVDNTTTAEKEKFVEFNFESMYIWDALLELNSLLEIQFKVVNKTIHIGDIGVVVKNGANDVNFVYGKNTGGLYQLTRTPMQEARYNRIIPIGSDKNLPQNYYRGKFPDMALRTPYLMPKIFRSGDATATPPIVAGTQWWYDHPDKLATESIKELYMPFEDIYPSIEGATYNSLPVDELASVPSAYIDTIQEDGKADESLFNIGTVNLGFNIPSYISSTEEMRIVMKTGACAGCSFKVGKVNDKSFNRYDYINNLIARPTAVSEQAAAYPAGTIIRNPILDYSPIINGTIRMKQVLYSQDSKVINSLVTGTVYYTVTIYFENEAFDDKRLLTTFSLEIPASTTVYLKDVYASMICVPENLNMEVYSGIYKLYSEVEVTCTGKEDFGKSYIMANFNTEENFIENIITIKDPPDVIPPAGGNTIQVQKDIETFGTLMPNMAQKLAIGDKFVILGIELPETPYIDSAEQKIETLALEELNKAFIQKYSYALYLDEKFLAVNNTIPAQLVCGNKVLVDGGSEYLKITQCSVKYTESKLLPEYSLTISNTTKPIKNVIKDLSNRVTRLTSLGKMATNTATVQLRTTEAKVEKVEALAHNANSSVTNTKLSTETYSKLESDSRYLLPEAPENPVDKFLNAQKTWVQIVTYQLPVATATVLGGVTQGSNVTIDSNGVISVAAPYEHQDYSIEDGIGGTKGHIKGSEKTYLEKLKELLLIDETNDALYTTKDFYSTKNISALGADIDKINFLSFTINENMELIMSAASGIDDFTFEVDENKCLILKTI